MDEEKKSIKQKDFIEMELFMIWAVNEALKYLKKNPKKEIHDAISYFVDGARHILAKEELKLSAIGAVNAAMRYKELHPSAKDKEIFQHVLDKSAEIIYSLFD